MQHVSYIRTKGYYLTNTEAFNSDWDRRKDSYQQYPNLVSDVYEGYTAYKFNKNYSIKAITNQTEHQMNSCGTYIASFLYKFYTVDNRGISVNIPYNARSVNIFEGMAQGAYYYTKVWRKTFYISGGGALGLGLINSKGAIDSKLLKGKNNSDNNKDIPRITELAMKFELQTAIGYNSKAFFSGIFFKGSTEGHAQGNKNSMVINDSSTLQLFVGYRFGAPKIINGFLDRCGL